MIEMKGKLSDYLYDRKEVNIGALFRRARKVRNDDDMAFLSLAGMFLECHPRNVNQRDAVAKLDAEGKDWCKKDYERLRKAYIKELVKRGLVPAGTK